MDRRTRQSLFYFDGNADVTLLEIQAMQTAASLIVDANKNYSEMLILGANTLKTFLTSDPMYETTGRNSSPGMERLIDIMIRIANFHQEVWSEVDGQRSLEKEVLLYEELKRKSNECWKQHHNLELTSENGMKAYLALLQKWLDLHDSSKKTKYANFNEKLATITGKTDVALTKYQSLYNKESKHRDVLAQDTEELKSDFMKQETGKLELLFDILSDVLTKMEKVAPQALDDLLFLNFGPEEPDIDMMAAEGWRAHLQEYVFQKYQGPEGTDPRCPQPILKEGDFRKNMQCPTNIFCVVSDAEESDTEAQPRAAGPRNPKVKSQTKDAGSKYESPKYTMPKRSVRTTPVTSSENLIAEPVIQQQTGPCLERLDSDDTHSDESSKKCGKAEDIDSRKKSNLFKDVPRKEKRGLGANKSNQGESSTQEYSAFTSPEIGQSDISMDNVMQVFLESCKFSPVADEGKADNGNISANEKGSTSRSKGQSRIPVSNSRKQQAADNKKDHDKSANQKIKNDKSLKDTTSVTDQNKDSSCSQGKDRDISGTKGQQNDVSKEQATSASKDKDTHGSKLKKNSFFSKIPNRSDQSLAARKDSRRQESETKLTGKDSNECPEKEKLQVRFSEDSVEEIKLSRSFRVGNKKKHPKSSDKGSSKDDKNTGEVPGTSQDVTQMSDVTVVVLKDRQKINPEEISIRAGMKIKQTRSADKDGMAYGYKKTKLGLNKYGLYPADHVSLYSTR
ncbi:cylicin-2-like [Haliotis asinina]|uniref:cylicin-2-like n=1 Tax=Haliotis asinina TaxID=109174 RepID=UPI003531E4B7